MQHKNIGFGTKGTLLLVYQMLAYTGYCAFTNFPQNVMSEHYGGTTTATLMNLIGSLIGYLITYCVVAPRIGRIKSIKRVGMYLGVIALACCASVALIPPSHIELWCLCFILVLITTQLWACFFTTMLIGNWFPTRKGTVMGIVTISFPIVTGICLNLFMLQHSSSVAAGYVISCSPGVGSSVDEGTSVSLVVSTGPEQTSPDPGTGGDDGDGETD